MGAPFETRFERGLPVMARGMDPKQGEGLDTYLNRVHQAIDTSHEKTAENDYLLLVAYSEGSEIKLKVMEAEAEDQDNHGGKSIRRYPRQALLDAMGTKTSRGVLTPDMAELLESLQKDKNGKRHFYNWALALGFSLGMADAIWQAGCFMLTNMTNEGVYGVGNLTHSEIMMFVFPIGLAMLAGALYYQRLIQQYKKATGSETVPDHISQACAKQGRQLAAKMFAAVATFTAVEYALKYNVVQEWLEKNVIVSDVFAHMGGTSIEMALVMSFIIGTASALAVVGTAMMQDKMDHGKLTSSASFYLALAASVVLGVVSWCFMANFGFDTTVDDTLSNKGAYIFATLATLALVTAAFKMLPVFQDGYEKGFKKGSEFCEKHAVALGVALTTALVIVGACAFALAFGVAPRDLTFGLVESAEPFNSPGERGGSAVVGLVSFLGAGITGFVTHEKHEEKKNSAFPNNR